MKVSVVCYVTRDSKGRDMSVTSGAFNSRQSAVGAVKDFFEETFDHDVFEIWNEELQEFLGGEQSDVLIEDEYHGVCVTVTIEEYSLR